MDQKILSVANEWGHNSYFLPEDRQEILNLISQNKSEELNERFCQDLDFGTGGLRAIMGMGSNRINKYTIRKATQALVNVLKATFSNEDLIVCVAYDSRNLSREFAHDTCSVLAANNIKTYLYEELKPVPLLSYSIKKMSAHAGIMITASHNPKEYNGYKVYWQHTGQVTPPEDKSIISAYQNIKSFDQIPFIDFGKGEKHQKILLMPAEVEQSYYDYICSQSLNYKMCLEHGQDLHVVYTALHGTGFRPVPKMLKKMGFTKLTLVESQASPDGNFPTAPTPNPELPETLKMAVDLMLNLKADLAIGTDPDTDRIGIAINIDQKVTYLTGNQIGTLLMYYLLENHAQRKSLPPNALVLKTIVTTYLQDVMAKHYGVRIENTLTGFKWMAAKMQELEKTKNDFTFLFGNEESFGYLSHSLSRDKDGVSSAALFCEMSLWFKRQNMNLLNALDHIYTRFGFSFEKNISIHYLGQKGAQNIQKIMTGLRENIKGEFAGEVLIEIEDYLQKKVKHLESNTEYPLNLPSSNVLGFVMSGNNRVYARPSGTEPKIKFYFLMQESEGSLENKKAKAKTRAEKFEAFIRNFCDQICSK